MSEKVKIRWREWAVISLAALLILGPLGLAASRSQSEISANSHYNQPESWLSRNFSNLMLVVIGGLQFLVLFKQSGIYGRQADIMGRQTDLQNRQMVIAHRPKLRVRNIVVTSGLFARGNVVSGQFYVSNVGGTNARVIESHAEFLWNVNGLPMERPYEGKDGNNPMGLVDIPSSLAKVGIFQSEEPYDFSFAPGLCIGPQEMRIRAFLLGWIDYLDDNGVRRRTAFCREFLQREGTARFYAINNDPDYEHED